MEVDWDKIIQAQAQFHAHTTIINGWLAPHAVVDTYHELVFQVQAITGHWVSTYSLQEFSTFTPSDLKFRRQEEEWFDQLSQEEVFVYEDRDPDLTRIISVQANEVCRTSP